MIFLDLPEHTIWYPPQVHQNAQCHLCAINSPLCVAKYYKLSPLPSMMRTTINMHPHQTPSPPLSSEGCHPLHFHLSCTPPWYHDHVTMLLFRGMKPSSQASTLWHNLNDHCDRNLRSPPMCHFCYFRSGILARVWKDYHLHITRFVNFTFTKYHDVFMNVTVLISQEQQDDPGMYFYPQDIHDLMYSGLDVSCFLAFLSEMKEK